MTMLLLLYQKKIHVFKNYICPILIANFRVKGFFFKRQQVDLKHFLDDVLACSPLDPTKLA